MASPTSFVFEVRRCAPELVAPAKSTPREFKEVSDLDDQAGLRLQMPILQFYRHNPSSSAQGRDPVKVIREAVAQALVFYYPLAGRLRELGPGKKLVVDCTGEGVLFIEGDADVRIDAFGDPVRPPFPCLEELLFKVPGSNGIVNCPLLLIQVTRLKCSGFIFALRLNHVMCDGVGIVQFMNAVAEMARGAHAPSITPSWQRELLNARNPARAAYTHDSIDHYNVNEGNIFQSNEMAHRSFVLGPRELSAIRRLIPSSYVIQCSNFEVVIACLWLCYTMALQPDPNTEVSMLFAVNARSKFNPPLPKGFYGNVIVVPVAKTRADKLLCRNLLGHAIELIRLAKTQVTEQYIRSIADLSVVNRDRPQPQAMQNAYVVSDIRNLGIDEVDFGWGKPSFGGPPKGWVIDDFSGVGTFILPCKTKKGEHGIMILVSMPTLRMERFSIALEGILNNVIRSKY